MRARRLGQSPLLLLDVAQVLADESIEYAVIGAMAASLYGPIRGTTDADALLWVTSPRLKHLAKALGKAGLHTELRAGDADDPIPALLAVTDRHGNRVDLLAGLRGVDPEAASRSIIVPFQGAALRFIGREDFIAMKCFAGGPQDIVDARGAINGADGRLQVDLLRRITRRFGRAALVVLDQLLGA